MNEPAHDMHDPNGNDRPPDHDIDLQPDSEPWHPPVGSGRLVHAWAYLTKRHRENWSQLTKFSIVGGSGYFVNLAVFSIVLALEGHYMPAAVVAFVVANTSNYILNRYWAFPRREHSMVFEYIRFLVVGLVALAFNLVILQYMVEALGYAELLSQAVAVIVVTPIGFLGNKFFTFKSRTQL